MRGVNLSLARANDCVFTNAEINQATLAGTSLVRASMQGADLIESNFSRADLRAADLSRANLSSAILVDCKLDGASVTGCRVHGIAAWNNSLAETNQDGLIITTSNEAEVTVDELEIAQFTYLLLYNDRIRDVIDTITTRVVLILGRFTPERKTVLDALRNELRKRNYVPVLFDFEPSASRNLTETVSTLAHMARLVIADLSDAKSIPQELQRIVPALPSVPVQPIIIASQKSYAMFRDLQDYPWVLPVFHYTDLDDLMRRLLPSVIAPPESKAYEIRQRRSADHDF